MHFIDERYTQWAKKFSRSLHLLDRVLTSNQKACLAYVYYLTVATAPQ